MNLELIQSEDLEDLISLRDGEQKLGERMFVGADYMLENMSDCPARFVVFGIPEDIGPRANCGRGGSDSAWMPFLKKFVNIQETKFISGSDILLLGSLDCSYLISDEESNLKLLRNAVERIDEAVSDLVTIIVESGKITILIGGGHNNAYGAIKGCSLDLNKKINVVKLDPHADFRPLEGRHSGNGFSYAYAENYLNHYHILGLHENYNSQKMLNSLKAKDCT